MWKATTTLTVTVFVILHVVSSTWAASCDIAFEGFGTHLGAIGHFDMGVNDTEIKSVIDLLYHDLKLRHFRTAYEPQMSPSPNKYDIVCPEDPSQDINKLCTWIRVHKIIASEEYENVSIFASVWSPPYYMKGLAHNLLPENQMPYYYFLKNITEMIRNQFGITIERISPVNEPENFLAPWDHTNMGPNQLCSMVSSFNDPLISLCPENSWFWVAQFYYRYKFLGSRAINCAEACKTFAAHSYLPNLKPDDPNFMAVYYDLNPYQNTFPSPVWMTEICSTYSDADETQMQEALDMSLNIANFVGVTCVQRYYYWSAFTIGASGESLIWGDSGGKPLTLPKKYYAFKHFALAAAGGDKQASRCDYEVSKESRYICLMLNDNVVFVNMHSVREEIQYMKCNKLVCTNDNADWQLQPSKTVLPPRSICSCTLLTHERQTSSSGSVRPLLKTAADLFFGLLRNL